MYVCMCNPFTDKDVKNALSNGEIKKTPAQIYKACSGGEQPCCGTCMCMIKSMVAETAADIGAEL